MDELQLIKQTVIKLADVECQKHDCDAECPLWLEDHSLGCLAIQLEESIDEGSD